MSNILSKTKGTNHIITQRHALWSFYAVTITSFGVQVPHNHIPSVWAHMAAPELVLVVEHGGALCDTVKLVFAFRHYDYLLTFEESLNFGTRMAVDGSHLSTNGRIPTACMLLGNILHVLLIVV